MWVVRYDCLLHKIAKNGIYCNSWIYLTFKDIFPGSKVHSSPYMPDVRFLPDPQPISFTIEKHCGHHLHCQVSYLWVNIPEGDGYVQGGDYPRGEGVSTHSPWTWDLGYGATALLMSPKNVLFASGRYASHWNAFLFIKTLCLWSLLSFSVTGCLIMPFFELRPTSIFKTRDSDYSFNFISDI